MKCDNQPRSSDVVPPLGGLKTAQPHEGGTTNTFSMTGFERQNSSVLWQLSNRVFVIPAPRFRPRVPPRTRGLGRLAGIHTQPERGIPAIVYPRAGGGGEGLSLICVVFTSNCITGRAYEVPPLGGLTAAQPPEGGTTLTLTLYRF
jgi:hypothetical protein